MVVFSRAKHQSARRGTCRHAASARCPSRAASLRVDDAVRIRGGEGSARGGSGPPRPYSSARLYVTYVNLRIKHVGNVRGHVEMNHFKYGMYRKRFF